MPWSEYHRKLRAHADAATTFTDVRKSPQRMTEEMAMQQAALAEIMAVAEEQSMSQRNSLQREQQRTSFIIRPQIRRKLVAEPADYHRLEMENGKTSDPSRKAPNYHPPVYPEQYPYMKLNNIGRPQSYSTQAIKQLPHGMPQTRLIPKTTIVKPSLPKSDGGIAAAQMNYEKLKTRKDGIKMTQFGQMSRMPANAAMGFSPALSPGLSHLPPNVLAEYARQLNLPAGVLRNGVADGVGLPARQLAATSLVDAGQPLSGLSQAIPQFTRLSSAPSLPIDSSANNLVNSIFAQSQPQPLLPHLPNQLPGIQQVPLQTNGPNPFETLLSNGNALDQISKLARNLLMSSSDGGQNNLLTAGLRALQQKGNGLEEIGQPIAASPQSETRAAPSMMEKLLSSAAQAINHGIKEQERKAKIDAIKKDEEAKQKKSNENIDRSLKLLQGVPDEQRSLLEAAIRSGELDPEAIKPAIKSLVKEDTKEESKTEKATRLIEWIKQNRPTKSDVVVASDKLPYYGKYCGSFADQANSTRKYKPAGAVWAVDNRRLIVSKFFFQPGSLTENITFWAGPNVATENPVADMFPSENGFYLQPVPIDVAVFANADVAPLEARIRQKVSASETVHGATPILPVATTQASVRRKRDTVHVERDELPPKNGTVHLVVKGGMVTIENPMKVADIVANTSDAFSIQPTSSSVFSAPFRIQQPDEDPKPDPMFATPLEWFAGFQPLLLTLPEHKFMKTLHWIALRDHKRKETVSSVLVPNGPGFQIPGVVTVRPLSPNGLFNVSSGPIKILDMKTIQVLDLRVLSGGVPLWFMIGKDILPNAGGHILPLYDPKSGVFDCDSLPDYAGETVTLRLPGSLDMKDVFWFSIFSLTTGVSYSHVYLPYNDMHLPPDLKGIPTPRCNWKSS